jgi:hypothetical protein
MGEFFMEPITPHHPSGAEYDKLNKAGLYGESFPAPNPRTFKLVRDSIKRQTRKTNNDLFLIDFGTGTGRYVDPILKLKVGGLFSKKRFEVNVKAYDPSVEGLKQITERLENSQHTHPQSLNPKRYQITNDWNKVTVGPKADMVVAMYGVLGLVGPREFRDLELSRMRESMKENGTLIVEVPNALRREAHKVDVSAALRRQLDRFSLTSSPKATAPDATPVPQWPAPRVVKVSREWEEDGHTKSAAMDYQLYNIEILKKE